MPIGNDDLAQELVRRALEIERQRKLSGTDAATEIDHTRRRARPPVDGSLSGLSESERNALALGLRSSAKALKAANRPPTYVLVLLGVNLAIGSIAAGGALYVIWRVWVSP